MTPIEKELLNKLAFWVNQAEIANKWYGNYDLQMRKSKGLTDLQKYALSEKRNQRQSELVTALNRIDEISEIVKQHYSRSTEPA